MKIIYKLDPFDRVVVFKERMKNIQKWYGNAVVADHFAGTRFAVEIDIRDSEITQFRRGYLVIFPIRDPPDTVHKVSGDRMAGKAAVRFLDMK